jgi:hypothetical protein
MMTIRRVRSALSTSLAAVAFAACSGAPAQFSPLGSERATAVQNAARALLYVSDGANVDVFALPNGNVIQTLTGFAEARGECANARGDVFIVDSRQSVIREYAHGSKNPIKLLDDSGHSPTDCSVDPRTGNLAVANSKNVAIFSGAKGRPVYVRDLSIGNYYFCAYDDKGDLFVDGLHYRTRTVALAELPKGKTALMDIALNESLSYPGGVKWDGRYLAMTGGTAAIYRFKISGRGGTKVGVTAIGRSYGVYAFCIESRAVYVPGLFHSRDQANVRAYAYPAGGKAFKSFVGFSSPVGAAVSVVK